jgi:hypothetical protein
MDNAMTLMLAGAVSEATVSRNGKLAGVASVACAKAVAGGGIVGEDDAEAAVETGGDGLAAISGDGNFAGWAGEAASSAVAYVAIRASVSAALIEGRVIG